MKNHHQPKNAKSHPAEAPAPAPEPTTPEAEALVDVGAAPEPTVPAAEPAAEVAALTDRLLRLQADFDNYRRRVQRDQADLAQRAAEALITELLPVLDNFELGLQSAGQTEAGRQVVTGFQLVHTQLTAALQKAGLVAFDAVGQPFDPQVHEAVTHQPSANVPAESVLHQTRRGYRLGSKLLRAAQVVVSSGPAETPAAGEGA